MPRRGVGHRDRSHRYPRGCRNLTARSKYGPPVLRSVVVVGLVLGFGGCGDDLRGITIVSDPGWQPALRELAALTPYRGLTVGPDAGSGYEIAIHDDPEIPAEGYRLEAGANDSILVHAHDVLGAQYGAAAALEALGFRFRHPFDPFVPVRPAIATLDDAPHAPEIRVRGLQLHTLHPIEGYFAFSEPSPDSTDEAHRIIDWLIKNRGNFLQWDPLDNILDPAEHAVWQPFTRELIDYAHARGVRVGANIQLFGQSNLQNAFDLSDDKTGTVPIADEIAARLPLVTSDLPFDVYTISFGEFFNADSQRFIDAINEVRGQLRTLAPQAEMHAVIHVGGEQRVVYMGEDLIYYFLVKFADPSVIPDIHTVMFYNLFESAGGAYRQENFDEHRAYLQQRMCAGQRAGYMPETAYWVAFDSSVPQFYPIYVYSRLHDLDLLQRPEGPCGTLDQHYLFSSGWEWGYWLNDVTALRASYQQPASPLAAIAAELAPDLGRPAAELVDRMSTVQHDLVMLGRLTGYLVGRDAVIDIGKQAGIVSQPDRVTFEELVAGGDRGEVEQRMIGLARYADELERLVGDLAKLALPDSRWSAELRDGFAIDQLRARFVLATYEATLAHLDGDDPTATAKAAYADKLLGRAQAIVTSRHADLHDPRGRRLIEKTTNQTFYQFGYLFFADTLCYWRRELTQVRAILGETSAAPPSCFF